MTLNLPQFPKRIFEDVYLTKIITRREPDNGQGTRSKPKHAYILIPKMMAEEQSLKDGSYLFKIKRLSDAYCEDELMLAVVTDVGNSAYPFVAQLPEGNGFDDGQAVYVKAKPFDLEKWFRCKTAKGFDKLTGYEEEEA